MADDDETRCIVLTGGDRFFAAGADLKELVNLTPTGVRRLQTFRHWRAIAECSKPVVAAVAGPALGGGCELALHADVIVAAKGAQFGLPEVTVGIMPGGGATQRLVRAIGHYRAMKLMLTGEPVSADEAWRLGMVTEVVNDSDLMGRTLKIASTIASRPRLALQLLKEATIAGSDAALTSGLMLERRSFELLFDTPEQKEHMNAFLEKRRSKSPTPLVD
jgi:enoyl-CoA hydratase/carnithine racemase